MAVFKNILTHAVAIGMTAATVVSVGYLATKDAEIPSSVELQPSPTITATYKPSHVNQGTTSFGDSPTRISKSPSATPYSGSSAGLPSSYVSPTSPSGMSGSSILGGMHNASTPSLYAGASAGHSAYAMNHTPYGGISANSSTYNSASLVSYTSASPQQFASTGPSGTMIKGTTVTSDIVGEYTGDAPGTITGDENSSLDNPVLTDEYEPIGDGLIPLLLMLLIWMAIKVKPIKNKTNNTNHTRSSNHNSMLRNHSHISFPRRLNMLLLALAMISGTVWADTWDGNVPTATTTAAAGIEGTGTVDDPFVIDNAAKLAWLGKQIQAGNTANGKSFGNKYWQLGDEDIDLGGNSSFTGYDWNTLVTKNTTNSFSGHFDGNNRTISNLQITAATSGKYYGLFPALVGRSNADRAVVENLYIQGIFIKNNVDFATGSLGSLVGYSKWANITNCNVSDVQLTTGAAITGETRFGGLVATVHYGTQVSNTTVSDVAFTANHNLSKCQFGGLAAYVFGNDAEPIELRGCSTENVKYSVSGTIASSFFAGGLVGYFWHATIDNCHSQKIAANFTVSLPSTCYLSGFVGYAAESALIQDSDCKRPMESSAVSDDNFAFRLTAPSTSGTVYIGGLVGFTYGKPNYKNIISDNAVSDADITITGNIATGSLYVGGLLGRALIDSNSLNQIIHGNTASGTKITLGGERQSAQYLGGLIGSAKGLDNSIRNIITGNSASAPAITLSGASTSATNAGGLIGSADSFNDIFNNRVQDPDITLKGAIANNAYISGGIGYISSYTNLDGLKVSGGSIQDETDNDFLYVTNGKDFYVGGAIGYLNSGGNDVAGKQNSVKNIAVEGLSFNLAHYYPIDGKVNTPVLKADGVSYTDVYYRLAVGGVIGFLNDPRLAVDGRCAIPVNIVSKDVKLYAPYARTSPLVAAYSANLGQTSITLEASDKIDHVERSRTGSWVYSGYKLGLSNAVLTHPNVLAYGKADGSSIDKVTRNYTASLQTINGVKYLPVNNTTFQKKNGVNEFEYECASVLWWTRSDAAGFKNDNIEQSLYPQVGNRTLSILADRPYYMYFFQGVNYGKYVIPAAANDLIKGIDANFEQAQNATPVTLTITDANATQRGFGEHTLTVAASSGSYSYQWYVDGADAGTGSSVQIRPDWRYGKDVVVHALDGGNVVASTCYALKHGVLKTKNAASDYVGMPWAERGTAENPYMIDCPEALKQLSYLSTYYYSYYWEGPATDAANKLYYTPGDGKYYAGHSSIGINQAYFELENDIDLGGEYFTPISHVERSGSTYSWHYVFKGHFDGKGHAIRNLKIRWLGGQYNGDANQYFGLFGAVGYGGAPTTTPSVSTTATCVIQNLIIDNAQLIHDKNNNTFLYNNGQTINANHVYVGVLAGLVSNRTTIQNIEVRNARITDEGSSEYQLAGKRFGVGGVIGRIQSTPVSATLGNLAGTVTTRFLSADCDINLQHAAFTSETVGHQYMFNAGGIIGSIHTTGASSTINWPSQTFFSGQINAPKAFVSPVFGYAQYSGNTSNGYADYCKHYMAKETVDTKRSLTSIFYGDYYIHNGRGYQLINNDYPTNVCSYGARTILDHSAHNLYADYYYQGVNYGEYINPADQTAQNALEGNFLTGLDALSSDPEYAAISPYSFQFDGSGALQLTEGRRDVWTLQDTYLRGDVPAHKLTVISSEPHDGCTYEWYINEVKQAYTGTEMTIPASMGIQLVKVVATKAGQPDQVVDVVAIPGTGELTATFTPTGKNDFLGSFTVTPNEELTAAGYTYTYVWKQDENRDPIPATLSYHAFGPSSTLGDNAYVGGTFYCTITATDPIAPLYDNPLYAHLATVYPATKDLEVKVKLEYAQVIFLHPNPTTEVLGGKTIPGGDDSNSGADYLHPVRTWGKAYSLLDNLGTWDDNVIVLMGKSDYQTTWGLGKISDRTGGVNGYFENVSHYGLCNVFVRSNNDAVYGDNEVDHPRYDIYKDRIDRSPMGKNVTITGVYRGVDYGAIIESPQLGGRSGREFYNFYGNTKFEYLQFYGYESDYDAIFGHYHDLYFGEGLVMKHFIASESDYGTIATIKTPRVQVFGGMHGDARFNKYYDAKNGVMDSVIQAATPNGAKGFTITVRSGYYSIICVGSRQTSDVGLQGSPNMPIKCTIDVDIDQAWNNEGDHPKTMVDTKLSTPYDIALILAGNHEGAMYADVDINVKSGRIARIINGSLGAIRQTTFKYGGVVQNYPKNTFFGRANILLDPASSTQDNSHITDINKRVIVTELYNGGVGRALGSNGEINMPSYGINTVTIRGGVLGFPDQTSLWKGLASLKASTQIFPGLYGGGAGGTNGIGYGAVGDSTHTKDASLPYWVEPGKAVLYGDYATYISKTGDNHLTIKCYNAETGDYTYVDPAETKVIMNIEGGVIGSADKASNVYGGGSGYTSTWFLKDDNASYPNSQAGCIFGAGTERPAVELNISGGTIYGNVYGGGKGTDYYIGVPHDQPVSHYARLAQTFGMVNTTISGGTIHGDVYAGAGGVQNDALTNVAKMHGNSTLTITGGQIDGNVYGGGEKAKLQGTATTTITGSDISGMVFAGGEGVTRSVTTNYAEYGSITGRTNLTVSGGTIRNTIWGGGQNATVDTTYVDLAGGQIAGNVYGGGWGAIEGTDTTYADVTESHLTIHGATFLEDSLSVGNHNIYGGGAVACRYTGDAHVSLLGYGPMKGNDAFMVDDDGSEMEELFDNPYEPHFSVFGGGWGPHTHIGGNTYVDVSLGINTTNGKLLTGCVENNNEVKNDDWSAPQSLLDVVGGGYNGSVAGNTYVHIGGNTMMRHAYGGSFYGPVGNAKLIITGGDMERAFGGSLMGSVKGSTTLLIGLAADSICEFDGTSYTYAGEKKNKRIYINQAAYGANDVSGMVDSASVGIYGGRFGGTDRELALGDIYGAGNGDYEGYYDPTYCRYADGQPANYGTAAHAIDGKTYIYKERPHTRAVTMYIGGNSDKDSVIVGNRIFGGGNSTNIGRWEGNTYQGKGRLNITFGSHVKVGSFPSTNDPDNTTGVYIGSNGANLLTNNGDAYYHRYWNGSKYVSGFPKNAEADFRNYCTNVLMQCDVTLTFLPGANNLYFANFVGGGFRGSMKKLNTDFRYTLPEGVLVTHNIIGGSLEANASYSGNGAKYTYQGGMLGGSTGDTIVSLDLRCTLYPKRTAASSSYFYGGNIFGGCYASGVTEGDICVGNFTSPSNRCVEALRLPTSKALSYAKLIDANHFVLRTYGAGYGAETRVTGNTYVHLSGNTSDPKARMFAYNVFGGSHMGSVDGSCYVYFPGKLSDIATDYVMGNIYGGGVLGPVAGSTEVNIGGGITTNVYGGARLANVGKGTYVNMTGGRVETIYGGNDIAGVVSRGTHLHLVSGIVGSVYGAGNGMYYYSYKQANSAHPAGSIEEVVSGSNTIYNVYGPTQLDAFNDRIAYVNSVRPNVDSVRLLVGHQDGDAGSDYLYVYDKLFCGGNASTVRGNNAYSLIGFGNYMVLNEVYMGANGEQMCTSAYAKKLANLNNAAQYSSTEILTFMNAIETKALPEGFSPKGSIHDAYVGTFCLGGNRGSMTTTDPVELTLPAGMTIFSKVVAGCNYAYFSSGGTAIGGFTGWNKDRSIPKIKLNIYSNFSPRQMYVPAQDDEAYALFEKYHFLYLPASQVDDKESMYVYTYNDNKTATAKTYCGGASVFGGCYRRGYIYGDVVINVFSDMLNGITHSEDRTLLVRKYDGTGLAKEITFSQADRETLLTNTNLQDDQKAHPFCTIFGAGFGPYTRVLGNTSIVVDAQKIDSEWQRPSVNTIFGGGASGLLVGRANIEMKNGLVYRDISGGAYDGLIYGSTSIAVGYPRRYRALKTGVYQMKRSNFTQEELDKNDGKGNKAIRHEIALLKDEYTTSSVYDAIVAAKASNAANFEFIEAETPACGWDNVDIRIGGAVYGGSYTLGDFDEELEVAKNMKVLRYSSSYTLHTYHPELFSKKNTLTGDTIKKTGSYVYGGNSTIYIQDALGADNWDTFVGEKKNHIRISHETDAVNRKGEGGVLGDGHSSLCAGFRTAAIKGYGYAENTPENGLLLNAAQRMDMLKIEDCALKMYGTRDWATGSNDPTIYSMSRVSELILKSTINDNDNLKGTDQLNSRNSVCWYNPVRFVGSINSNVGFDDVAYHDSLGVRQADKTYFKYKSDIIRDAFSYDSLAIKDGFGELFHSRNIGTAKNMISLNNDDNKALHLQIVQEAKFTYNLLGDRVEEYFYGPLNGVVEFRLPELTARGGGYVYANNQHKQQISPSNSHRSFMQTSGNVVFVPRVVNNSNRRVYDDCYSKGYINLDSYDQDMLEGAHFWFVEGTDYTWCGYAEAPKLDTDEMKYSTDSSAFHIFIRKPEHLAWIYRYVDDDAEAVIWEPEGANVMLKRDFSNAIVYIDNDIELDELTIIDAKEMPVYWCPIGDQVDKVFRGRVEGNGYKINGMKIDMAPYLKKRNQKDKGEHTFDPYYGLFAKVDNAALAHIELSSAKVIMSNDSSENVLIGTLAAKAERTSIICSSADLEMDLQGNGSGRGTAAGMVGNAGDKVSIRNSHANGVISGNANLVAGLVGKTTGNDTITYSYSRIDMQGCNLAGMVGTLSSGSRLEYSYANCTYNATGNTDPKVLTNSGGTILGCKDNVNDDLLNIVPTMDGDGWSRTHWNFQTGFTPMTLCDTVELTCADYASAFAFDMPRGVTDWKNMTIDDFSLPRYGRMQWATVNNTYLFNNAVGGDTATAHRYLAGPDRLYFNCDEYTHQSETPIYVTRLDINRQEDRDWVNNLTDFERTIYEQQVLEDNFGPAVMRAKEIPSMSKDLTPNGGFDGDVYLWQGGQARNESQYAVNGRIIYYFDVEPGQDTIWSEMGIPFNVDHTSVYRLASGNEYTTYARSASLDAEADGGNYWLRQLTANPLNSNGSAAFQASWTDVQASGSSDYTHYGPQPWVLRFPRVMKADDGKNYLSNGYWNSDNSQLRLYSTEGNSFYGTEDYEGHAIYSPHEETGFYLATNPTLSNIRLDGWYWIMQTEKVDIMEGSPLQPDMHDRVQYFELAENPVIRPFGIWMDCDSATKANFILDQSAQAAPARFYLPSMNESSRGWSMVEEEDASFIVQGCNGVLGVYSLTEQTAIRVYDASGKLLHTAPLAENAGFSLPLSSGVYMVTNGQTTRKVVL